MSRRTIALAAIGIILLSAGIYFGSSYLRRPRAAPVPGAAAPGAGEAATPGAAGPTLDVTVDGAAESVTWPGEPIVVSVTVLHPSSAAEKAEPIAVAARDVSIEVTDVSGKPAAWRFQAPSADVTVDHARIGRLAFLLSQQDTSGLGAGRYRVRARLGRATSAPASVEIVERPAQLAPDQDLESAMRLAAFHTARGDAAGALTAADDLVKRQPRSPDAHALRATLLARSGRRLEALEAWNAAIGLTPPRSEAARRMFSKARGELFAEMTQ